MNISVVIPTYQRAALLGAAVESVLAQDVEDIEVIVVDDGSTDETATVVRGIQDERVRYISQPNRGRSHARNLGLAHARGELVGFLDSDDVLEPGALAAHLAVHREHPGLGMTIAGYAVVDAQGALVDERLPWRTGGSLDLAGWIFDCYGIPGSVLHRRAWLERCGAFDPECEIAEDWDLYLRMAAAGCPMRFVEHVACRYRLHSGNSIHDVERHWRASRKVIEQVFARADLPADVLTLARRAFAWVDLVAARRSLLGGDRERAVERIHDALERDPGLAATGKVRALELLLAPTAGGSPLDAAAMHTIRDAVMARSWELRAALARTHLGAFFRAVDVRDWPTARRSLRDGLCADPRWLFNRGVIKLGLRSLRAMGRGSDRVPVDAR